ncbi:MAG: hypothetical protein EBY32_04075 [Proteobacteria bacterium]|nr:hypothetical protein [Pseudomonadota bacterium]
MCSAGVSKKPTRISLHKCSLGLGLLADPPGLSCGAGDISNRGIQLGVLAVFLGAFDGINDQLKIDHHFLLGYVACGLRALALLIQQRNGTPAPSGQKMWLQVRGFPTL